MPDDAADLDDNEPWIIPLHGIDAPIQLPPPRPTPTDDAAVMARFYDDDELPNIEFRPRLRRSA